nr:hypothetical protein [Tanacetum cinerariifolium]GFA20115.1 hypothetical protein [Tanacetum cinerariifolium]
SGKYIRPYAIKRTNELQHSPQHDDVVKRMKIVTEGTIVYAMRLPEELLNVHKLKLKQVATLTPQGQEHIDLQQALKLSRKEHMAKNLQTGKGEESRLRMDTKDSETTSDRENDDDTDTDNDKVEGYSIKSRTDGLYPTPHPA